MTKTGATAFVLAIAMSGCADAPSSTTEGVASHQKTAQAIIKGTVSAKEQNFVVQISKEENGKFIHLCSGSLIAKNLVITARHCVGDPSADDLSVTDYAPSKVFFYFGTDASKKVVDKAPAEARGAKLFTSGKTSLTPDIAVVQLDKEIEGQPIAPIRLEGGAVKGETLNVVGFGVTEKHIYPILRLERKGVTVESKGPGKSAGALFDLAAGEFQFGEAACVGDSGGPALSTKTGAIVGIASRVTNGQPRDESLVAQNCVGTEAEDVYTDLTPAKAFIESAFEAASASPWIEGEPSPAEKEAAAKKAEEDEKSKAAANAKKEDEGCAIVPSSSSSSSSSPSASAAIALLALLFAISRRARVAS